MKASYLFIALLGEVVSSVHGRLSGRRLQAKCNEGEGTAVGNGISKEYGRVVVIGDSLLDGNGSTEGKFEETLSTRLENTRVENNAVGGNNMRDISELPACSCKADCQWSVISGGINNMYDQSVTTIVNDMKQLVQRELEAGKKVVILGYVPDCNIFASGGTFDSMMESQRNYAASTPNVWFVDPRGGLPGHPLIGNPCSDTSNTYRIVEDNSHPSPFGGRVMAEAVSNIIRANSSGDIPTSSPPEEEELEDIPGDPEMPVEEENEEGNNSSVLDIEDGIEESFEGSEERDGASVEGSGGVFEDSFEGSEDTLEESFEGSGDSFEESFEGSEDASKESLEGSEDGSRD